MTGKDFQAKKAWGTACIELRTT